MNGSSIRIAQPVILIMLASVSVHEAFPSSHAQEVLPVSVEEWSIWVGSPAHERINDRNAAGNAMPSVVGTARPKQENPGPSGLPINPVSVVRFLGEPIADFDLELRLSSGTFLSHWPPARERVDSLRWFGANLSQNPPPDRPLVFLSEAHPFRTFRELNDSLVIEVEERSERFLAYDAELDLPIPLTLQDGPDDYTLQNLSPHSLYDLALIVPTDDGYRIGWLDELPAGQPAEEPIKEDIDSDSESNAQDDSNRDPALDVFDDENGDDPESRATPPPPPVPAEADAVVRARIEQRLNQSVTLDGSTRPVADVLQLIRAQTGLQTVQDDQTLADAKIDLGATSANLAAGSRPARDVLAEMLGKSGLSYRITEDGWLFLSTSERLEAASDASPAQVKGPPVTLTLSDVFTDSEPVYAEVSARELLRRLVKQGIREDRARATLDQLGDHLFRPDRLIVLAHLDRAAIDELVPLDVFPPVDRTVRVATVIISGIDPGLSDQASQLVTQLGDPSASVRETAERELLTLGPVAIPALRKALDHQDLEIVYRAERLLRQLKQPLP